MNKIDGSTAGCEIELKSGRACGVQAIGRCATCERAFCLTHQGRGDGTFHDRDLPYVDMCAPCLVVKRAADAKRKEEADAPRQYIHSGAARAALLASGVQPAKIYSIQTRREEKKGFFGGSVRYATDGIVIGNAWILGEFKWEYDEKIPNIPMNATRKVTKNWLTALRDVDPAHKNNYGIARVQPYSGGYQILDWGNDDSFLGDEGWDRHTGMAWRGIAQAVKRLIGESS